MSAHAISPTQAEARKRLIEQIQAVPSRYFGGIQTDKIYPLLNEFHNLLGNITHEELPTLFEFIGNIQEKCKNDSKILNKINEISSCILNPTELVRLEESLLRSDIELTRAEYRQELRVMPNRIQNEFEQTERKNREDLQSSFNRQKQQLLLSEIARIEEYIASNPVFRANLEAEKAKLKASLASLKEIDIQLRELDEKLDERTFIEKSKSLRRHIALAPAVNEKASVEKEITLATFQNTARLARHKSALLESETRVLATISKTESEITAEQERINRANTTYTRGLPQSPEYTPICNYFKKNLVFKTATNPIESYSFFYKGRPPYMHKDTMQKTLHDELNKTEVVSFEDYPSQVVQLFVYFCEGFRTINYSALPIDVLMALYQLATYTHTDKLTKLLENLVVKAIDESDSHLDILLEMPAPTSLIYQHCLKHVATNFARYAHELLLGLSEKTLLDLFSSNDLRIGSEDEVIRQIYAWYQHNYRNMNENEMALILEPDPAKRPHCEARLKASNIAHSIEFLERSISILRLDQYTADTYLKTLETLTSLGEYLGKDLGTLVKARRLTPTTNRTRR